MVIKCNAKGLDETVKLIESHENATGGLFLLFSGSKDATGNSWCPDCVKAEPVIEEALKLASDDAVLVHVNVGDRPSWKDPANIFRTDPRFRVNCVPTLMRYGSPQRLQEEQCANLSTVQMLFED